MCIKIIINQDKIVTLIWLWVKFLWSRYWVLGAVIRVFIRDISEVGIFANCFLCVRMKRVKESWSSIWLRLWFFLSNEQQINLFLLTKRNMGLSRGWRGFLGGWLIGDCWRECIHILQRKGIMLSFLFPRHSEREVSNIATGFLWIKYIYTTCVWVAYNNY